MEGIFVGINDVCNHNGRDKAPPTTRTFSFFIHLRPLNGNNNETDGLMIWSGETRMLCYAINKYCDLESECYKVDIVRDGDRKSMILDKSKLMNYNLEQESSNFICSIGPYINHCQISMVTCVL